MKKALSFLQGWKRKYIFYGLGALAIIVAGIFMFGGGNGAEATIIVERGDFLNQVAVSGRVQQSEEAELGFAASGRVGRIFARENDAVRAGQLLAQLEIGDLLADLKIKEISAATSDVDLEDARENLEKVRLQEETKVESAYRSLLSEDLEPIPYRDSYGVETPTVSGIYDGAEGQYKIRIDRELVTSPTLMLKVFGLEKYEKEINDEGPMALGTRGLYITFPEDSSLYEETYWILDIPNKAGSAYVANYNAWNEAKKARDLAVKSAEFEYERAKTEKNSGSSSVAQAEIDKIRAEIRKNTIYAPFDGIVTSIEKEIGETAATNEAVVSVMGNGAFEIESFVPEVNIALIEVGDEAEVTLDAYGESEVFQAKVISIDPAETVRDGVSTYKIKLAFLAPDERVKAGMTANVSIIIFNKPGVIVVPGGVIFEQDGKQYVKVKTKDGAEDREVVTGDVSTLGQVEIVAGLEAGEEIILSPEN